MTRASRALRQLPRSSRGRTCSTHGSISKPGSKLLSLRCGPLPP